MVLFVLVPKQGHIRLNLGSIASSKSRERVWTIMLYDAVSSTFG